jgi:hypothetical protein
LGLSVSFFSPVLIDSLDLQLIIEVRSETVGLLMFGQFLSDLLKRERLSRFCNYFIAVNELGTLVMLGLMLSRCCNHRCIELKIV